MRQKIVKDCRDVGDNFAEEARKIHYGEAEAEGIYGQATQEERESLKDEGIEIFDMPWVPSTINQVHGWRAVSRGQINPPLAA